MKTNTLQRLAVVASLACLVGPALQAQIPQLINYQGRVVSGSANFNGTGQFKFAIVGTVLFPEPHTATLWSNDGTGSNGSEPTSAVSLTVTNGLYSVLLGDTSLTNMTNIPATVFNNSNLLLRVWFNDGTHGSQQLSPDQRIAAVGYAMMAAGVPDGSITGTKIASSTITSANIVNGAIGGAQIASGAVGAAQMAAGAAASNLNASGQSGVASGGIVLSATNNNTALTSAGYVKIGTTTLGDSWQQDTNNSAPSGRHGQSAVWTGSEMIIWGGDNGVVNVNSGARYNPVTDTWMPTSTSGAPSPRDTHTALWTGSEMIVWGGFNSSTQSYLNDGGRYNPASDTWTVIPTAGAPSARESHSAVWTGTEMIVWGGFNGSTALNDGARFNPSANGGSGSWTSLSGASGTPPSARTNQSAVWTGSEMIIWGGSSSNTGGRYNPGTNSWTATSPTGAPSPRDTHTAVWTGNEMIVWGGSYYNGTTIVYLNDGGRYNPASNNWVGTQTAASPPGRAWHTAIWTGTEMIVWGGYNGSNDLNDGSRYNPSSNTWIATATPSNFTPSPRSSHSAVWTGSLMVIWGGDNYQNDTWSYAVNKTMFLYQKP